VGVIGVGTMGAHHARAYDALGGLCELHGVHDPDHQRARAVAERFGTRAYPDLAALLDEVEAVSIASPTALHVEHALAAIERGVDVLVEKPVALSASEALRLQAVAAALPRTPIVQVGHIEHFNPAVGELRKLLAGEDLVALDVQRLGPFDGRDTGMDVVQDLMLHDIHVLLSFTDAPLRDVHAAGRRLRSPDHEDYAVATLVFADGVIATLAASRVTEEKIRRLTASTASAHVTVDYLRRTIEVSRWGRLSGHPEDAQTYRQESVVERIFVPLEEPLAAQLRSFLGCVRERTAPEVGLGTALRCLDVVEAVREAASASRRAVAA
jgi:predicted dehydrogenase